MTDPYRPPEHGPSDTRGRRRPGYAAPLLGCGLGGCLLPILLFIACAFFFGDTGGPLIWPIAAGLFGGIGLFLGFLYREMKK